MFVRRKEFYDLQQELYKLKQHVGRLTTQTEKNTNYGKRNSRLIETIKNQTGVEEPGFMSFRWLDTTEEIRTFNLTEKVEAILEHLGLTEVAKLGNKLVPAPKKPKGEEK